MPNFDLVTVSHFGESPSLRLQARSIGRWLSTESVGQILLIVNESLSDPRYESEVSGLLPLYGDKAARVNIVNRNEVCEGLEGVPGYVSQQVLKLRAVKLVESPFYTVLDTKNILIGPVGVEYLFDGKIPKSRFETYNGTHQAYILNTYFEFLGVPEESRRRDMLAMMTPFTFSVEELRAAVDFVELTIGKSIESCFCNLFVDRHAFSEFLLFCAAVHSQGKDLSCLYRQVDRTSMTLWPNNALGLDPLRSAFEEASATNVNIIGLHSRRISQMDTDEIAFLTRFFRERQVISESEVFRPGD